MTEEIKKMASNLKTKKAIVCFLFLVSFFLIHSVSFAEPVTFDRAMQVAANWMLQQTGIEHQAFEDSITFSGDDFQDHITPYYIFNMDPGGWVIVSGDDIAYPIIGYSVQGAVDAEDVPPAFIEWMALIEEEIREEVNNDSEPLLSIETAWEKLDVTDYELDEVSYGGVSPLIQTTWSQGKYYNTSCPADSAGPDGHALVGCCATAIGQVMKYHNWPVTGSGSHSYYHSTYGTLSANFGATTYNWSSMPASGQVTSYNTAVATLLYHVGVSIDMNYGPSSSGCSASKIATGFGTYFKYKPVTFVYSSGYSTSVWLGKLTTDLNAARPIVYVGSGSGGHAFVCDGYTGTDYFHFNWGWNGSYDGYFYLNDLTPGSHNYNSNQGAIFGIQPAGETPGAATLVSPTGTITDTTPTYQWNAVSGATWYRLYVREGSSGSVHDQWYTSLSVTSGSTCSVTPTTTLNLGGHTWWIQTYNSYGYGPWSSEKSFTVSSSGGGFNSQFKGSADGWESHWGDWAVSGGEWYNSSGVSDTWSTATYAESYTNCDYRVRFWREENNYNSNRILVRATPDPLGSPDKNLYSYYSFQYTRNGSYSVWKRVSGISTCLQGWTSSSAINGTGWNDLRVVASGSNLCYYINGTLVWSGSDSSLSSGRAGLGMYGSGDAWVDWATLTTSSSGFAITDEVSEEQQALNDAAREGEGGSEEQCLLAAELLFYGGDQRIKGEDAADSEGMMEGPPGFEEMMMEGPPGFEEMMMEGPPDAEMFQEKGPFSMDQGEGV
jgi:hypothetical protein